MNGNGHPSGVFYLKNPVPLRAGQKFKVEMQFDRASDPEGFDRVVALLRSRSDECNEGSHEDCDADDCACDCHAWSKP